MFYLIVISLIGLPILAVEPTRGANEYLPSTSSNPIARWIELHKRIYDYTQMRNDINTIQLKSILREMSTIEQTEAFKLALVNNLRGYNINHYRQLVDDAYQANLLTDSDATITNLLLQTYDYDSNDCTAEYFGQLDEINQTFESNQLIAKAIQENREKQYKNCWDRFMESLVTTSMLIGSRLTDPLNTLVRNVYPSNNVVIVPPIDSETSEYREESARFAQIIASFLKNHGKSDKIEANYRHMIERPCELLIDTTIHIMMHIYAMLKYSGYKREFITSEDAFIINRYTLCDRIVADNHTIGPGVLRCAYDDKSGGIQPKDHVNLNTPTDFGREADVGQANLITQHLPLQIDPISTTQFEDSFSPTSNQPESESSRKRKRADDQISPTNSNESQTKKVIRVDRGIGKGRDMTYPTYWSDGSVTMETRQYLKPNWNRQWLAQYRKKQAVDAAYYEHRDHTHMANIGANIGRVIRVERSVGSGKRIRYPTFWSDGNITVEEKQYLIDNWPDAWNAMCRQLQHLNEIRFLSKDLPNTSHANQVARPNSGITGIPSKPLFVLEIQKGFGRGLHIKYPTIWSDGSKSIELKEDLEKKWPEAWKQFSRSRKSIKQARYIAKKRLEELEKLDRLEKLEKLETSDLLNKLDEPEDPDDPEPEDLQDIEDSHDPDIPK